MTRFVMTSGSGCRSLCPAAAKASEVRAPTIGVFSTRCFGWRARAPAGETFPLATVKRRYYRWIEMGVLDAILEAFAREADLEWLMTDSTIVRAHQHAAGARRQKGGLMLKALDAPAAA